MMKKNLFYIFALMFSFIVLSSANVLADNISARYGLTGNKQLNQDLYILSETNLTYVLNITITPGGPTEVLLGQFANKSNVTSINITLPSGLTYIANSNYTAMTTANTTLGETIADRILTNFETNTTGVLVWRNTTLQGLNLSGRGGIAAPGQGQGNTSVSNVSLIFNVTAPRGSNSFYSIGVGVLYSGSDVWNHTTINITVVDLVNISNRTTLTFNEDVVTGLTFSINNSNVANYPSNDNTSHFISVPITNVTIQLNNLVGAIASAGANSNSTTHSAENVINSTRFNGTRFGWVNSTGYLIAPGQQHNFSLNVTISQPGNWTVTIDVYYNETVNGLTNYTTQTFTIYDTTAPTNFTYSCTPTSIYQGETLSCPCSAVDNYYVSGGSGLNISVATLEVQSTGTYSPVCTALDGNGNSATATSSYTVNSQTSTSTTSTGGAGGGYSGSTTHNVNSLSSTESKTITSESQENLKFKTTTGTTSGTTFKGTIDTIGNDSVTLTLVLSSGLNKELTISSGSTGKVDLDEDGTYDLSVTLSGISSGVATLAMKEISETVPVEVAGGEEETETITGEEKETTKAKEPKKNLTWLWTTLVAIAVIAVVIFYLTQKKGPVGVFFITLFSKNSGRSFRKKK